MDAENIEELLAQGWQKFELFSSYYGSHEELGEGDSEYLLLFHPKVDLSLWEEVSFHHGHFSKSDSHIQFDAWLSGIPDEWCVDLGYKVE